MNIKLHFKNLTARDRQKQTDSYNRLLEITQEPVVWSYDYWDKLEQDLSSTNGNDQLRAVELLSNLAISDPKRRMFETFDKIKQVTESDTATTQREAMTYIWRIALAGKKQQDMVEEYLLKRYHNEKNEKLTKMLKTNILVSLKKIALSINDEDFSERLEILINEETDLKQYKQNIKALDRVEL